MKTVFEIVKTTRVFSAKNKNKIAEGCTVTDDEDIIDNIIESYENLEDAIKALEKYKSNIDYCKSTVPYYLVTEYYVVVNKYDDDGEWESCNGIWTFAKLPTID